MDTEKRKLLKFLFDKHRGRTETSINNFFISSSIAPDSAKKLIGILLQSNLISCNDSFRQLGNKYGGQLLSFDTIELHIDLTNEGVLHCQSMNLDIVKSNTNNAFISFTEKDRSRMLLLFEILDSLPNIKPIIVERDKDSGADWLPDKVLKNIEESDFFIPIITSESINSQWVNQEVGCAFGLIHKGKALEVHPLIQMDLLDELKGFINKQKQCSYLFKSPDLTEKDFKICCEELKEILSKKKSKIGEYHIR